MVPLDAIFGPPGRALVERLGATPDWPTRFDIVEAFVMARLSHAPSPEIAFAWQRLARRGGGGSVAALATEIGWSRQRLHARCRAELGLAPKALARLMRFNRACALARRQAGGWADVAAEAGYADQPHLVREFRSLAGEAPSAWARRVAAKDPRLRDAEG
jgi:AraC-like DNA-binding protein